MTHATNDHKPRPPPPARQRSDALEDIDEQALHDPERLDLAQVFAEEHHEPPGRIGEAGPLVENQWYASLDTGPLANDTPGPTPDDDETLADLLDEVARTQRPDVPKPS